jgi:hypothetical protein
MLTSVKRLCLDVMHQSARVGLDCVHDDVVVKAVVVEHLHGGGGGVGGKALSCGKGWGGGGVYLFDVT